MSENKKRDYQKERQKELESVKRYTVKVPIYWAKALEEKLKAENKTYSSIAMEAIKKYLEKK